MADYDIAAPTSADAFARLAIELHDAPGVEETVEAVVEFALQALNCIVRRGRALHPRPPTGDRGGHRSGGRRGVRPADRLRQRAADRRVAGSRDGPDPRHQPRRPLAGVGGEGGRSRGPERARRTADDRRPGTSASSACTPPSPTRSARTTRRSRRSWPGTPRSRSRRRGTRRRWSRRSTPANWSARRWAS